MIKLFKGLFDSNEKELRRLQPYVDEINRLEPGFESLSDAELRAKTDEFKGRLAEATGEIRQELREESERQEDTRQLEQKLKEVETRALDELLPEAFCAVREAAKRTIGQRHFDVQLMGGIVLHQGKIAEMKTGEGKTLVATLPAYLNALTGEGCHLVTVNDYLARRDCRWMGPIYSALGVSVASINAQQTIGQAAPSYVYDPDYEGEDPRWSRMRPVTRREAYESDITYGTNNEFGFDYLRDNMVLDLSQCVQRPLNYAIVDEVDNILIDEARTPLIISGAAEEATKKYYTFSQLVSRLSRDEDYTIDERSRTASLTDEGITKIERMLRKEGMLKGPDLYDPANYSLAQYLESALKANVLFKRDKDYVVKDGQVIIVDEFTGRLMVGRRYSEGLHQAIEAKERVKIQQESVTLATITFQNYFRLYHKLAGMTGTAVTEAEEFHKIYKLEVTVIPTNKPMIRDDHADQIYKDEKAKFAAVAREIKELHDLGRPVLVGTTSIEQSDQLAEILKRTGIVAQVLNAKHHEREADIVADAGRPGAVTVATQMAGRGVDVILGGTPPGYKAFESLADYIGREVRVFVEEALKFLRDREEDITWAEAYRQRLGGMEGAIRRTQEELGPLIRRYYQEFGEQYEVAEDRDERDLLLRSIEQKEETLRRSSEELLQEYEQLAGEVEARVKLKQVEAQGPGKDTLPQRIKGLLSRKAGGDLKQPVDLVLKGIQEARTQFRDWRERNRRVVGLGGLHIIGTEHHEARRIDNQLRGRAGRQGDPGSSRFYASLEDEIVRRFGGDRVRGLMQWAGMDENTPIEHPVVNRAMANAQVQTEGHNFSIRKHLVEYDDVINRHREVIYAERKKILSGADLRANILSMVEDELRSLAAGHTGRGDSPLEEEQPDRSALLEDVSTMLPLPPHFMGSIAEQDAGQVAEKLIDYAVRLYEEKESEIGAENMRIAERLVMLRVIDRLWMEHLTRMEELRQGIGLRAVGQEQPLIVYKREGQALFDGLLAGIQHDVARMIYRVGVTQKPVQKKEAVPVGRKVGRNDPCPCGSGKKHKHCCGK